jgi:ubiquinone/menaquinone biosynthesis C-methylase UbiE
VSSLYHYAKGLGDHFPLNCGNPLVAGQYALPLEMVLKYLKPPSALLDWGCGGGHFSYLLMQERYTLHAYAHPHAPDLSVVQKAAERNTWNFSHSHSQDPIGLPFAAHTFEGVISLGVLEHVKESGGDEKSSLQELYRILKPGGYFLCFHFPNRYSWIEAASRALRKMKIDKFCHSSLYTKKKICDLLHATPFRLIEIGKYNLFPRRMLHLLPEKLGWNPLFFHSYRAVEKILFPILGLFAQNYYFVVQK